MKPFKQKKHTHVRTANRGSIKATRHHIYAVVLHLKTVEARGMDGTWAEVITRRNEKRRDRIHAPTRPVSSNFRSWGTSYLRDDGMTILTTSLRIVGDAYRRTYMCTSVNNNKGTGTQFLFLKSACTAHAFTWGSRSLLTKPSSVQLLPGSTAASFAHHHRCIIIELSNGMISASPSEWGNHVRLLCFFLGVAQLHISMRPLIE